MQDGQGGAVHAEGDQGAGVDRLFDRHAADERRGLGIGRNVAADQVDVGRARLQPGLPEQGVEADARPFGVSDGAALPGGARHPGAGGDSSLAYALNEQGQVTGVSDLPDGDSHAFFGPLQEE